MATAGTGGEVLNTGPGEVGRAAGVDGDERREVDLDQPLRRYCPAGQLPTPWAQTQALGSCVSPRGSELRLGYHAGTDGTDGAIHGVRTAIAAIDQLGLLDEWNTTITPFWRPVHMDPGVAVEAALELTQTERVNVVVGGGYSEISEQAQYIFKLANIPQVGYSSTADTLTDNDRFPTFSRICPTNAFEAQALAEVTRDFNFRYISLVYSSDSYGKEMAARFQKKAERLGITFVSVIAIDFTSDPNTELPNVAAQLKEARTNVNAACVGNSASAFAIFNAAAEAGIGPGADFVWIGFDGWFSEDLNQLADSVIIKEQVQGSVGVTPYVRRYGDVYENFLRMWQSTEVMPALAGFPSLCDAKCLQNPPWDGVYAYDATMLIAKAWAKTLREGGDPGDLVGGALLKAIRSVDYVDGVTGNVTLDSTGNVKAKEFSVYQFIGSDDEWTQIGSYASGRIPPLSWSAGRPQGPGHSVSALFDFGLGPGVVPGDGGGPSAENTLNVVSMDDPYPSLHATLFIAVRNRYEYWVKATPQDCEGYLITIYSRSDLNALRQPKEGAVPVYSNTCYFPDADEVDELYSYLYSQAAPAPKEYPTVPRNGDGIVDTPDEAFLSALGADFVTSKSEDTQRPGTASDVQKSLCACPIFNNAPDEVTVASVTYQGERVPDLDNIVISPDKGGGASTALILSIALPIALVVLLVGAALLAIRVRRKARRRQRLAWLFLEGEIVYDDPEVILGQGSHGDVVRGWLRGRPVAVKRTLDSDAAQLGSVKSHDFTDTTVSGYSWSVHNLQHAAAGGQSARTKRSSRQSVLDAALEPGCLRFLGGGSTSAELSAQLEDDEEKAKIFRQLKPLYAKTFEDIKRRTQFNHPNIVAALGVVVPPDKPLMLVRELMVNGSLHSMIDGSSALDFDLLLGCCMDVVAGLKYLHYEATPPVVHGDLKSMNVLLNDRLQAKLSDYGLQDVRRPEYADDTTAEIAVGSVRWMAPELMIFWTSGRMEEPEGRPSEATDVYSLGVLMYEMFTGLEPYAAEIEQGMSKADFLYLVAQEDLRPAVPELRPDGGPYGELALADFPIGILHLMEECWNRNPRRRPNLDEVEERLYQIARDQEQREGPLTRMPTSRRKQELALLHEILPPKVAKALSEGRKVEPEPYDPVTVFFSDIVGFTKIGEMRPEKVMAMLDNVYSRFDALAAKHGLFKVETIGDAYMCAGGIPERQADHTLRVARFALEAVKAAAQVPVDPEDMGKGFVRIRCGFHSGRVVASVVGSTNPRYCLFGDTVNVASRMESCSEAGRITMSKTSHEYLQQQCPKAQSISRGLMNVKGKGDMELFWLDSAACPVTLALVPEPAAEAEDEVDAGPQVRIEVSPDPESAGA